MVPMSMPGAGLKTYRATTGAAHRDYPHGRVGLFVPADTDGAHDTLETKKSPIRILSVRSTCQSRLRDEQPIHPMPRSPAKNVIPSCGCSRACRCQRELRCRCHDHNALLALMLWDYSRALRRQTGRPGRSQD